MKTIHEYKFSNGDFVEELVTGIKGTITGSCHYLTGCNQYLVVGKQTDPSREPLANWYDEGRIKLIQANKILAEDVSSDENGCDICPPFGKRGA